MSKKPSHHRAARTSSLPLWTLIGVILVTVVIIYVLVPALFSALRHTRTDRSS